MLDRPFPCMHTAFDGEGTASKSDMHIMRKENYNMHTKTMDAQIPLKFVSYRARAGTKC